jgi:hypothetical protein
LVRSRQRPAGGAPGENFQQRWRISPQRPTLVKGLSQGVVRAMPGPAPARAVIYFTVARVMRAAQAQCIYNIGKIQDYFSA